MDLTLNVYRCCWLSSWCYRSYSWCVGCWGFFAVNIFTNNCHCWGSSNEWFFWYKCHCTVCGYCVSTNSINSLSRWTIIKCCWNIVIHWYTAIAFCKYWLTSLCSTLNICWCCWSCSRCDWCHSWCVLRCDFSSVLIHAFHCYAWSSSSEWFFWNESYCSVCCYCVCTNAFYCLSGWTIFEGSWNVIVHWYTAVTFGEGWLTGLSLTLDICRCCWGSSWSYWCHSWCVSCWGFCAVNIFTNNCHCWGFTNEWFLRYEGYCSICGYCVCTNTFYCLSGWTIIEGCWNVIVHWHTAITFSKFRLTCLCCTLDICWCCWFCSWCNRSYFWSISRRSFCAVLIFTDNCHCWSFTNEWFLRYESYCSICYYCVSTNTFYCLSRWAIFESSWCIFVDWNIWITFGEAWFTCLCCTLDIGRCGIFRCWNNWSNLRCVCCFYCCSICISCLNFNWNNITWIRFIRWCEGYDTCVFINGECTNNIARWWFRKHCRCWLAIFIKKGNGIFVNWSNWISLSKGYSSRLNYSLRSCWFCRSCSRCDWSYGWCVGRWSLSAIHIFTNNCYGWCFTSEWFFWNKGYCSVRCYCVGTYAVNCLSCWTIFEGCWNVIVHWHTAVALSKFRLTCLSLTLFTCWCCVFRSWCNWGYCWCICCSNWSTVLINTFNRYACTCSCEWFFWDEGYSSVRSDSVSSFSWNCLRSWAIFKGCWNIIIHWDCRVTRCEAWCTCLRLTLDVCRCCGLSSWYNWSDLRCVSCLSNSSVCIFTLNLNWNHITWVRFIRWCEGHNTSFFINSEGTDHITCWWFRINWCCWLTIFVKKSNGIFVDWCNWVTFCEGHSSSLNHTLRCFWFCWSCCWSYWCHSWCVLSSNWSTVLIDTFNRYACTFSCEWFFWYKGYSSIWSNSVSSFTWNGLRSWAIFKCCRSIIIHWKIWITWCEGWCTCLRLTLFVSRCCIFCSWCNWCYGWCICRRSFSSVHIFTNHCYSWCSSNEWFFWYKGYCTVCCYCVSTNTIYSLRSWAIIEGCWNIIVHRHTAVTFCEFRFTSLSRTLDISCFSWCSCWSYWCHSWCVLGCDFSAVLIHAFHCYACSSSSEWFFWYEGYCSIWRNSVCSFTIYCLSCWTIFKGSWCILIDWNIWIAFREGWFTCLSLTLDICWCRIFRCWNNWSDLRCISCFNCCSICISCLNLNWDNITWIRFISWCEGYNTCFFINSKGTDFFPFWWFSYYRCCWLTIFIKKSNRILVNWRYFITFSEGYSSSLNKTLRSSRFSWCCCWSYWSYSWCVSCRSFCSVLIFTNNCYGWCCSCKWFLWNKCHSSVCCYCVSTNAVNCLSCWTIVEGCWNVIVHWHTAIAFSKFRLTCLSLTLFTCWCCIFRSRSYRCHSWCVFSCDLSSVLIHAFHCYAWTFSSKWFFWNESYGSIWRNGVSSFTIYCLGSWAIFESSWSIFIDWNIWITFCEGWFTRLCLALDIGRCRIFRSWNDWSNLRCVSCFYCCSICISCLNLNWNNITWVRFICWCECHNTCFFIDGESTNHITCWWFRFYWCCWLTSFIKKSNGILVNWSNWITFCEGYGSSLH